MFTCRRAAERLSRSLDASLPVAERIGLHAHLLLCAPCRQFRRHLELLHTACRELPDRQYGSGDGAQLSDAARERIAMAMEHEADRP